MKVQIADDLKSFDYFGYTVEAKAPVLSLADTDGKFIKADTSRRVAGCLNCG